MNANKQFLQELTKHQIAHRAFVRGDEEWEVVGKYCRCTYLGNDRWDVWLCNPKNLGAGLTQRRIRSIARKIPDKWGFQELTGEGVYPSMPTEVLLLNRALLGLPKRRKQSGTQLMNIVNNSKETSHVV